MKQQSDELYPRHIQALSRAVRDARRLRGMLVGREQEEFDANLKLAREALKLVRELGRQHKQRRWVNSSRFPGV